MDRKLVHVPLFCCVLLFFFLGGGGGEDKFCLSFS